MQAPLFVADEKCSRCTRVVLLHSVVNGFAVLYRVKGALVKLNNTLIPRKPFAAVGLLFPADPVLLLYCVLVTVGSLSVFLVLKYTTVCGSTTDSTTSIYSPSLGCRAILSMRTIIYVLRVYNHVTYHQRLRDADIKFDVRREEMRHTTTARTRTAVLKVTNAMVVRVSAIPTHATPAHHADDIWSFKISIRAILLAVIILRGRVSGTCYFSGVTMFCQAIPRKLHSSTESRQRLR